MKGYIFCHLKYSLCHDLNVHSLIGGSILKGFGACKEWGQARRHRSLGRQYFRPSSYPIPSSRVFGIHFWLPQAPVHRYVRPHTDTEIKTKYFKHRNEIYVLSAWVPGPLYTPQARAAMWCWFREDVFLSEKWELVSHHSTDYSLSSGCPCEESYSSFSIYAWLFVLSQTIIWSFPLISKDVLSTSRFYLLEPGAAVLQHPQNYAQG